MAPTLIVGDIHGCLEELQDLLTLAGLPAEGWLVSAGDFVDRGPSGLEVARFLRERPNTLAIRGNHERKHVSSARGKVRPALSQRITREQGGEARYRELIDWLETLPLWLDLGEVLVAHGYWLPGVPLGEQPETVLAGSMTGDRLISEACGATPWYELYDGPKPLVVGHHDYLGDGRALVWRGRVFGLDTGCCHGGRLTGLLLPSFELVSVPARADHWAAQRRAYAHLALAGTSDDKLDWEQARALVERAGRTADLSPLALARAEGVRAMLAHAEVCLTTLHAHLHTEVGAALDALRREEDYDAQPPSTQGQLFARHIGRRPFGNLLHHLRRHGLEPAELRRRYPRPAELVAQVEAAGLVEEEG
ncbi:MAG: metallophosphoesterase family protein [Pseudomonadota bacterium]